MSPPVALTIAGSDSAGGAGVQADLKTFAALGVFGTSAVTVVTAQNTRGVRAVHPVPAAFVVEQIEAVLDDLPVAAVKTGMLAGARTVVAVADLAAAGRLPNLVVDPVLVSSTGERMFSPAVERLYRQALLPHAVLATPNLAEAQVLLGAPIRTVADQHRAARELAGQGPTAVVVKGGRQLAGSGGQAVDVVCAGSTTVELRAPWVDTANVHGSGCTFAAATAAALARGLDLAAALRAAKSYVSLAVAGGAGWRLGAGHGPLDHLGWRAGEPALDG